MYKNFPGLLVAICLSLCSIAVFVAVSMSSDELLATGTPTFDLTPSMSDKSPEKLRAVGRSMHDYSPLYIVFCPVEKTISGYDSEGWLIAFHENQDEDAFWALVELNAKVTGHSMAGNMEFFLTWNATIFDDDVMTVTIYNNGIRTVISFDKNLFVVPNMHDDETLFYRHLVLNSVYSVYRRSVVMRGYADLSSFITETVYDVYGNSIINVIVEDDFFKNFINESLHSLSNQELNELIAPFRAIALAISDTYELNWTFHDACEYFGRHRIIRELESSLLSISLEEYEQNLREFVPLLLLEKLVNYLSVLIDIEYEAGIISRVQMIELRNMIFRSDRASDQVMNLKETILQKLQPTNTQSIEVLDIIDNVTKLLQNFQ